MSHSQWQKKEKKKKKNYSGQQFTLLRPNFDYRVLKKSGKGKKFKRAKLANARAYRVAIQKLC